MKRKLITKILLSAIVVLTAFQVNAQSELKIRILADTSGLAKGERSDSFPKAKSELYSWFSVKPDGSVYLRPSGDTAMAKVKARAQTDLSSVFKVNLHQGDSSKFSITPLNGAEPLALETKEGERTPYFRLMAKKDGDDRVGEYKKLLKDGGYLVYDPGIASKRMDTMKVALVGADRNGTLSLRYFNEFAIYGDPLPNPDAFLDFQYGKHRDNQRFDPGKLYQTGVFPFFQIYDKGGNAVISATEDGNGAINWGNKGSSANSNDSIVYAWFKAKVKDDATIMLLDTAIRLDSIVDFVGRMDSLYLGPVGWKKNGLTKDNHTWKGFDTLSTDSRDKILPFDSSMYVYLTQKETEDFLSFTVKRVAGKEESDWTNGYPKAFKYKDGLRYYRIDTAMMYVLADVVNHFKFHLGDSSYFTLKSGTVTAHPENANALDKLFYPSLNTTAKSYLYKNKADGWRPLYVKVQEVKEAEEKKKKYEYVGEKWLEDNKLLKVDIIPEVPITADLPDKYISDGKGKISLTDDKGASFRISLADTIRKKGYADNKGNWFAKEKYPYSNNAKKFENEDSVELFNISDGKGHLLTVSDERDFEFPLRNSLEWTDTLKTDGQSVRQMFAIVRDYTDGSFTFLPVAARYWAKDDTRGDSLSFNLAIGRGTASDDIFVDLSGAWHLESSLSYKLVVADSVSKTEPLRFKLTSPFHRWEGPKSDYVAVKKKSTGKYYRGTGDFTGYSDEVKSNDIGAQWTVKQEGEDWKFTPAVMPKDKDTKPEFAKADKVSAYSSDSDEGDYVYLQWSDGNGKDTVLIERGYGPEDFDLYDGFEKAKDFIWKSDKGSVTVESSGKYLSYDDKGEVSYVIASAEDSPVVTIHRSREADSALISTSHSYRIPYYRFSCTKEGEDYYLKAENEGKISWEKASDPEKNAAYRFYLPAAAHDGKFYLHSHDGHLMQVSKDGSKLSLDHTGDIYRTVNAINDATPGQPATLEWTITKKGDIKDKWAVVDTALFDADSTAVGVLVIGGAGETFIGLGEDGKGILSDRKDGSVLLKLKAVKLPAPQSIVAYSPLKATAESEERAEYHIIHGNSLYLTDKGGTASVTFSEKGAPESQTFSFLNNATDDGFAIVLSSDEDRYLSSRGLNLVFSDREDDRLSFKWGTKDEYGIITGIKVINATAAKAYGVSGGVKVANASGAVSVYTVDGRLVTTQAVTSPNQTITVPAGIYIVRNGAGISKVVVK